MRAWMLIFALATGLVPGKSFAAGEQISAATLTRLRELETAAADLKAKNKSGRKLSVIEAEIARIRTEYNLGGVSRDDADSIRAEKAARWARQREDEKKNSTSVAEEAARKKAEFQAEQRAKAEALRKARIAAAAKKAAEARAKEQAAKAANIDGFAATMMQARKDYAEKPKDKPVYYSSAEEWREAQRSHLNFAQLPIRDGGLGLDRARAETWVSARMAKENAAATYGFRARYVKLVGFAMKPRIAEGLGLEVKSASDLAVEIADKYYSSGVDHWIEEKRAALKRVGACPEGYGKFH